MLYFIARNPFKFLGYRLRRAQVWLILSLLLLTVAVVCAVDVAAAAVVTSIAADAADAVFRVPQLNVQLQVGLFQSLLNLEK
jgi:uncharacterized membrane protein